MGLARERFIDKRRFASLHNRCLSAHPWSYAAALAVVVVACGPAKGTSEGAGDEVRSQATVFCATLGVSVAGFPHMEARNGCLKEKPTDPCPEKPTRASDAELCEEAFDRCLEQGPRLALLAPTEPWTLPSGCRGTPTETQRCEAARYQSHLFVKRHLRGTCRHLENPVIGSVSSACRSINCEGVLEHGVPRTGS